MMRIDMTRKVILAVIFAAISSAAFAQVDEDADFDFRARVSAEVDKKIVKGFHVSLSEEFRLKDDFSSVDRFYTTVGLSYKFCPYFKAGVSYTLMNLHRFDDDADKWGWNTRHRASLDLTGMYRTGNVKFNLRERFQLTHRTGDMNVYQNPRNALVLRSRFKVSYEVSTRPVEPYMSVEVRNTLNAVHYNSPSWSSEPGDNISYNDVYVNRVRLQPGVEWRLNSRNSFDFYLLADYVYEKDIDADKSGNLKKYKDQDGNLVTDASGNPVYRIFYQPGWNFSLGVAYKYEF